MKGQVFNIQKYALHDGPGIRTTVFFKGCPLKCLWCHNPESIKTEQELSFNSDKCIKCSSCSEFTNAEACPTLALEQVGCLMTVQALFDEIQKDIVFYEQSSGGVTFSGGEPLLQSDFLLEILKMCKKHNIHTAIDTTGFSAWEKIAPLLDYVDLFLFDIKHMSSEIHQQFTGVPNELILENFKKIILTNDVYVRVPLIKGFNDSLENITELCRFVKSKHTIQINFLPYHGYAENKYSNLLQDREFSKFEKPDEEHIQKIIEVCKKYQIICKIGG